MNVGITLKNYRCFPDDHPASFRLEKGFTALVGSNNAGKSTLLKFFWEFRPLFQLFSNFNGNVLTTLMGNPIGLSLASTVRDSEEVFCNRNTRDLAIELDFAQTSADFYVESRLGHPTRFIWKADRATRSLRVEVYIGETPIPKSGLGAAGSQGHILTSEGREVADFSGFLLFCRKAMESIYIPAFRNAINAGELPQYFDIQTGRAFIAQWRAWKAGDHKAASRAAIRLTEMVREIFGYDTLVIDAANNNETLQLIIDGEPYMLPELGSGIAQFLMVLANAAVKRPPFVLIDEPELNLHPSLQRKFLQCLASFVGDGVIFATHNLGLALAQADRSYSVRRVARGQSEVRGYGDTPRLSEFLGELSFGGYKELGFDKILLVEGVTDLRAVQHFLSFYGKQNKVVLLPLGGNALINGKRREELQEVQRICPQVHALIDSEKASATVALEKPRQDFVAMCASLSPPISCHVLDLRSLENYFPDGAVKAAFGPRFSALAPYARAPDTWKVDNWRIAEEMQKSDIDATDLGLFLNSI